MTDAEWLNHNNASAMLEALRPRATDRQLRLIATACCRHLRQAVEDPTAASAIDGAIEAVERYADGIGTRAGLKRARQAVRAVRYASPARPDGGSTAWCVLWVAEVAASENACGSVIPEIDRLAGQGLLGRDSLPPMCDWLRCVFGPPSRNRVVEAAWRSPEAMRIARSLAEGGSPGSMAGLGEALRAAGCDDPHVMGHCGAQPSHLRGCWVLAEVLEV